MQRKPPAIFAFGNERGTTSAEDLSGLMCNTPSLAAIRNQTYRRNSLDSSDRPYLRRSILNNSVGLGTATLVAAGGFGELIRSLAESQEEEKNKKNNSSSASSQQQSSPSSSSSSGPSRVLWTTIPPRHALHMPIMKINPEIWRYESHNREIHRIMREARQQQIMKRRNIKAVMDTVEDDEEEDRPKDSPTMTDVIANIDLGGWHALEEQQKEKVREQVMNEWKAHVEREYAAMAQREQQQRLLREQQQQIQLQQQEQQRMQQLQREQQLLREQQQQQQLQQQLQLQQLQQQQLQQQQQQRLNLSQATPSPSYSPNLHQRLQQLQQQQRVLQQQQQQQQLTQPKWLQPSSAPVAY
ncbi:hypothetical protein DFQ26_000952, partial [Actinomortierella ambigua]